MDLSKESCKRIRGLIIFAVVATVAGVNYQRLWLATISVLGMIFPFLLGAAIAFILNVPMRALEKKLKLKRPISLILAIILVLGIIATVMIVVVPELIHTVTSLQQLVPKFIEDSLHYLEEVFAQNPQALDYLRELEGNGKEIFNNIIGFLSVGASSILSTTYDAAKGVVSGFTTFGIGFVFAVYILLQKEVLSIQFEKVFDAYLPQNISYNTKKTMILAEKIFSSFLTGQCLEAIILGIMFFVTLLIFQMPYAVLIGVLIAFTALIPIFGAFIGCVIGAFLIFMIDPTKAALFIVIFLVLQQVEGNFIYPHVVGNSVGLPSIWVLVAVTLGGSMMGIVGMLVFIPCASVLYSLLKESVNKKLKEKELTEEN